MDQLPASSPSFSDLAALNSDLGSLTIPPVQCSFPWCIHPDYLRLREIADAWIVSRFGDLRSISSFSSDEDLMKPRFDLLVTLGYPNGIGKRMTPILKFMGWLFALDNFLDDPNESGAELVAANEMINGVYAVFEAQGVAPSAPRAVTRLLIETGRDWWDEMCEEMPVLQQRRFKRLFKDYLDANRTQVRYRRAQRVPDLETYNLIRKDTGAWLLCAVLIEYALGFELDEETLAHPLVCKLRDTAACHVHWVNDLISFKKEFLQGDYLNAVGVMYLNSKTTPRPPLQQIVSEVSEMIKGVDNECVRVVNEIKKTELLMEKPGMESFLEGVGAFSGGSVYWHLVSSRF